MIRTTQAIAEGAIAKKEDQYGEAAAVPVARKNWNIEVDPVEFELHPDFASKIFVADLPLSRVLLQNERNYPWILLIPRRRGISRIMQLSPEDQLQLLQELDLAQNILWDAFTPTQLNVAAIGNKTPQLHLHVIARFAHDPAWPGTVWDHPTRAKYSPEQLEEILEKLKRTLENVQAKTVTSL